MNDDDAELSNRKQKRPTRSVVLALRVTAAERDRFKAAAKSRNKSPSELMEEGLRGYYAGDENVRDRKLSPPPLTKNGATRLALAQTLAAILAQAQQWHEEAVDRGIDESEVKAELERLNESVTEVAKAAGLFPHLLDQKSKLPNSDAGKSTTLTPQRAAVTAKAN